MINKIVCNAEDLTAIADAVRASNGSTNTYNVPELSAAAVNAIGIGVNIDDTLTIPGAAADAAAVGKKVDALTEEIVKLKPEEPNTYTDVIVAFVGEENHLVNVSSDSEIIHQGVNFAPPLETNSTFRGISFSRTNDNRIAISGTITADGATKTNIATYLIPYAKPVLFPAGVYVISSDLFDVSQMFAGASGGVRVISKNSDGTVKEYIDGYAFAGNSVAFELAEPTLICAEIRWNGVDVGAVLDAVCYIQIERGEEPSNFEPYRRTAYSQSPAEFWAYTGKNIVYNSALTPVYVELSAVHTDRTLGKMGVAADGWETGKKFERYGKTPQDYGAVGDGITDDTFAVQTCLDKNAATYFPVGKYRITSPLIVGSGKSLIGYNRTTVQIIADNCDCLHFVEGASNGYISGIAFIGDESVHKAFLFAKNVQRWNFENIIVQKFGDDFFYANNMGYVGVLQFANSMFGYGGASCFAMACDAVSQINSIDIRECEISHFPHGNAINISGVRHNIVSNTIQAVQNGINIQQSLSISDEKIGLNSIAITIASNYFEGNAESCIRVVPFADQATGKYGFIAGILIIGNYGLHSSRSAAAVRFSYDISNPYEYSANAPHGDGAIKNLLYVGNYFIVNGGVLMDGGNVLQHDSIIIADSMMGDCKNFIDGETTPYTMINMGNACVRSKYAFAKAYENIRNSYTEGSVAVTSEDVTMQPGSLLYLDMRHVNIVNAEIPMKIEQTGTSTPQITIYGYRRNGEKVCTYTREVQSSDISSEKLWFKYEDFITDTATNVQYPSSDFVSYTIVIKAAESTVKVGNPVVKYIPN